MREHDRIRQHQPLFASAQDAHLPPQGTAHLPLPWWRSSVIGYLLSPVCVGLLTLARLFVNEPLFVWTPFCLVVVLEGVFWGVGPALLAMTLALLATNYLLLPEEEFLTLDIWDDLRLLGPFVFVQIVIILLAAQHAVQYRRTLAAKEALQIAAQELERTNRQLEQTRRREYTFFTRAAHELRTPLTTILGEVQLALRRLRKTGPSSPEMAVWRAHCEHIEARARGLHALVEELIELYHLQGEDAPLRWQVCNVSTLCADLVEQQRQLSGRLIELEMPSEPVMLQADGERLRSALVNIVENAVKYAPPSTPISVRVQAQASSISIQVHNEGAFSVEQQERLFEPFYRSSEAEATYREGWGLGLTISKASIERHGGRIRVEASAGEGITFFVELPIQVVPSSSDG